MRGDLANSQFQGRGKENPLSRREVKTVVWAYVVISNLTFTFENMNKMKALSGP
jgi:hypothetical protein